MRAINTATEFVKFINSQRFDYSSVKPWELETIAPFLPRERVEELKCKFNLKGAL